MWFFGICMMIIGFCICAGLIKQLVQHGKINIIMKLLEVKKRFIPEEIPFNPPDKKTPNK